MAATQSVAYCDLKLQRYREALSNLELAEQELGGGCSPFYTINSVNSTFKQSATL